MKRDTATAKIRRMVQVAESGAAPTPIRKIWIFGSYRRGALECGDVDVAVLVDSPSDEWYESRSFSPWEWEALSHFRRAVSASMKRRGERVDLHLDTSEDSIYRFFASIPVDDPLLVWSDDDREWEQKLATITPTADLGRYERPYPIDLKRTGTSRKTMEDVLWLIERERLALRTECLDGREPQVSEAAAEWLDLAGRIGCIGKDTLRIMPFAYDWLHREGQQADGSAVFARTELFSATRSHLVHLGRIDFSYALGWLFNFDEARKLCLIPHLRKRTPNVRFIVERGPAWTGDRREVDERI